MILSIFKGLVAWQVSVVTGCSKEVALQAVTEALSRRITEEPTAESSFDLIVDAIAVARDIQAGQES